MYDLSDCLPHSAGPNYKLGLDIQRSLPTKSKQDPSFEGLVLSSLKALDYWAFLPTRALENFASLIFRKFKLN